MKVLIIKTSSMGDIIHALPALTDAHAAFPNISFDWVAEQGFAEVPLWHKSVNQVIPTGLRRWRKNPLQAMKSGEIKNFIKQLRATQYDLVLDAQASIKSAITTRITRGPYCGMDFRSVREAFANLAYQKTYRVDRQQHAIDRLRQLFSQALQYPLPDTLPDYGIDPARLAPSPVALPKRYIVFVHTASWRTKCWPEDYWLQLLAACTRAGFEVLLPWGNEEEHQRAIRIAAESSKAHVLPRLSLSEVATVLHHASAAVCNDTGLAHMAAALNVPAVTLYGPTDPSKIGTVGKNQARLRVNFPCAPCRKLVCNYKQSSEQRPACFTTLQPKIVWETVQRVMGEKERSAP